MALETWNALFLWASVAFAVLAELSTGAAIITGHALDTKKDAEIQSLKPRHLSVEQMRDFGSVAKGDGSAAYSIQVAPDKRSIESGIYATEIETMLRDNGWMLVNALGYAQVLIPDKPGITVIYNSQNPPPSAAMLERGLRAAKIEFIQENPRFIGMEQPLFIAVNPR